MSLICRQCRYYLFIGNERRLCGLGKDPNEISECDDKVIKEEGEDVYVPESCDRFMYYYPIGKGIEQAPKWLRNLRVLHYSRTHERCKTGKDKSHRTITLHIILPSSKWTKNNLVDWSIESYESSMDKSLVHVCLKKIVGIREEFLKSRKRRHRHCIE